MAVYGPNGVSLIWADVGGSQVTVLVAVEVALAVSGGNTDWVSADGNLVGLWGVPPEWAQAAGVDPAMRTDPDSNARVARFISQDGSNFGDWGVMYSNGVPPPGPHQLSAPQPGSAAGNLEPTVLAALGPGAIIWSGGAGGLDSSGQVDSLVGAETSWADFQDWVNRRSVALHNYLLAVEFNLGTVG